MGGASDEVSLFAARVVALTPIFGEHLGIIGDSVGEVAREKLGAVCRMRRHASRHNPRPNPKPRACCAMRRGA